MFIGPCIILIDEEWKINLISLAILFHFLCVQNVSEFNISIIKSFRLLLNYHIGRLVLTSLCAGDLEQLVLSGARISGWSNTGSTQKQPNQISNNQRTENKKTDVVIQQQSQAPDDGYINVRNTLCTRPAMPRHNTTLRCRALPKQLPIPRAICTRISTVITQHLYVNPATAQTDTKAMCWYWGMLHDTVLTLLARATCPTELTS